jgi:tRNA/rRNA methyltransferase
MSTLPKSSTASADISADISIRPSDSILSRVRVVMVETSHPGNVGSATRAMKTMGLTDLVLVAPKRANVLSHPDALALSASASDVLASTRIVATLEEAIADTCFALAFTARRRGLSHPIVPLREAVTTALAELAANMGVDANAVNAKAVNTNAEDGYAKIALVFGNEAMCLNNEQVALCQLAATIPSSAGCYSLNVSQSVQVAAYEVMMQASEFRISDHPPRPAATAGEVQHFLTHLERTAYASGFLDANVPKRFLTRMQRLFTRSRMEPEEVAILRGLLAAWEKKIENSAAQNPSLENSKTVLK